MRGREARVAAIRSVALERLDRAQARTYLERRRVTSPELCERILASCGGWPLALSLAADLVEQFDIELLSAAPEWHLAVQALVEQLMDDVAHPALRMLLEAGAVVRQFDEETLAALTGEPAAEAFATLCRLSIVRPTVRGLALHDGTTDAPTFPAGGGAMIVRRAYSAFATDDSVVARVGEATLERTGSVQFVLDSGSAAVQVRCSGLTAGGVALDKVVDVGANSEQTIYAQAENISFFTCGLLEPVSRHQTLITLQRVASSNPYFGYLLSTTNQ